MKTISVSAPGKIHLLGEHSVVYGKPAILAAINKRCFVELSPNKDARITITSQNFQRATTVTVQDIISLTTQSQNIWETYKKTGNLKLLQQLTKDELSCPQMIIGETLRRFEKTTIPGFDLAIRSEIPIGCGLGSSGALAVAVSAAVSIFLNDAFDKAVINGIAFSAEQKRHGNPSGGDNTASCYGGLVWYRKEVSELIIMQPLPFVLPQKLHKLFFLVQTGKPDESTGEMVHHVRELHNKRPKVVEQIFTHQELLVRELYLALQSANERQITEIIAQGEQNLEKIGVVSPLVTSCIKEIIQSGGAAKICGGGGKRKSTGAVLVIMRDEKQLQGIVQRYGFSYSPLLFGEEGVRQE